MIKTTLIIKYELKKISLSDTNIYSNNKNVKCLKEKKIYVVCQSVPKRLWGGKFLLTTLEYTKVSLILETQTYNEYGIQRSIHVEPQLVLPLLLHKVP